MRILLSLLALTVPYLLGSQLKVEWVEKLTLPGNDFIRMTGMVKNTDGYLVAVATDKGTSIYQIPAEGTPSLSYTVPLYMTDIHYRRQDYFTKEHCNVKRRALSNEVLEEHCFMMQPDWPAGSSVSCFTDNYLYHAEGDSFLKFDLQGKLLFRSKIGELVNTQMMSQGGVFVYVFSHIDNPSLGYRLMQYDTLGNQKWSLQMGMVNNIVADKDGNCYVFILVPQTSNIVSKYDPSGNLLWSSKVFDQTVGNGYLQGDSLLVCGIETIEAANGNIQNPAFSILDTKNGSVIYQQKFDFYPPYESAEAFTEIAGDGNAIYIGGQTGGQTSKNFLVKLSKTGATGLNEQKPASKTSLSIFPNPGSNNFTLNTGTEVSSIHVTVRNVNGQVIYKKELTRSDNNNFVLDLGKQPAGTTYSVEVISGKEKVVKKIVVE
jgi:hypothetical protein